MRLRTGSVSAVALLGLSLVLSAASARAADSAISEHPGSGQPAAEVAAQEPAFPIEGLWYVLIHYTDDHSGDPTRWHWEDHLWVIERDGKRLRWRDYPLVVFEDDEGRFERVGNNPMTRTTGAWEPNPAQREQIRAGLHVNDRGLRTKTLYPAEEGEAPAQGEGRLLWSSAEATRSHSVSTITFSSTWQIAQVGSHPIFSWDDLLASARSESMEGRTEFRAEEAAAEGVVQGRFERDGVRHGRFRLYPTADPSELEPKKRGLFR